MNLLIILSGDSHGYKTVALPFAKETRHAIQSNELAKHAEFGKQEGSTQ